MKLCIYKARVGHWVLCQGSVALATFDVWADALAAALTQHPLAAVEPTC